MIIVCAKITYYDGEQERTIGVCDQPYYGDATGLEGGLWHLLIPEDSELEWSEQVRHPAQSSSSSTSIGDLYLNATGGNFDSWPDYFVRGYRTEVRRANSKNMAWSQMERVLVARNKAIRFTSRREMILSLEPTTVDLEKSINGETWEEAPSEALIGKTRRTVLGRVFQAKPPLYDPSQLVYYCADNFSNVFVVAEGGNPTDTAVNNDRGFQLLQSPSLVVTSDFAGPETDIDDAEVVFEDDLSSWTGTDLDDWTLRETSGKAEITESSNGADISVSGQGDTQTSSVTPDSTSQSNIGYEWSPNGAATLKDAVQSDDGSYAEVQFPAYSVSKRLEFYPDVTVPGNAVINGIEITLELEDVNNASFINITMLRDGSEVLASNDERPDGKETVVVGGDGDTFGADFSASDINSSSFGLKLIALATTSGGGQVDARVHAVSVVVYYSTQLYSAQMLTDIELKSKARYRVDLTHEGASIACTAAGVGSDSDKISESGNPFDNQTEALNGDGTTSMTFTAGGPYLGLRFFNQGTSGSAEITNVTVSRDDGGQTKYSQLVEYICNQVGADFDSSSIKRHGQDAGNPDLGWLVESDSAIDTIRKLALSCRGAPYGGANGRLRSIMFSLPGSSGTERLYDSGGNALFDVNSERLFVPRESTSFSIDKSRIAGEIESYHDEAPNLTDSAVGAKNWHPIDEDRSAGITTTWTQSDKELVSSEWRITRKAVLREALFDSEGEALYDANSERLYTR